MPITDSVAADFIDTAYDKAVHGVYNALGRNIGWFDSVQELARGQIHLYPNETLPNPREWRVKRLGIMGSAADYIIAAGLVPYWLSQAEAAAQKAARSEGLISQLLPDIKIVKPRDIELGLPSIVFPSLGPSPIAGLSYGSIAILGGLGLLALLALRKA